MIPRRVPTVQTPITGAALAGAALAALGRGRDETELAAAMSSRFDASGVVLLDSGTSALVMALRLMVREGNAVAMPGYGCPDLAAAAVRAGVRVRLYDLDPTTLSPDLASLERALRHGAGAVVLVHFFGYAADATAVAALARRHGARVIEDAAQRAGGSLDGVPLGAFGDLVVLSFGRGKGIGGGGGGALLVRERALADDLETVASSIEAGRAGWRELVLSCAATLLGRPSLYAIPSAIPALRLGEMVDREAEEPRRIAWSSCALASAGLACEAAATQARRATASRLREHLAGVAHLTEISPVSGAHSGHLRLALLDGARRGVCPALGIVRPYPIALAEHAWMRSLLAADERAHVPGAVELSDRLLALPTHQHVRDGDLARIARWLGANMLAAPLADRHARGQQAAAI